MKFLFLLLTLILIYSLSFSDGSQKSITKKSFLKIKIKLPDAQQTVSFKSANVTIAKSLLPDTNYRLVLEEKTGKYVFLYDSLKSDEKLVPTSMHAFVNTVYKAYADHRPLKLSPDMIWLLIAQGISIHVNENHANLKNVLFKNNEPIEIYVRNDSLVYKTPQSWKKLVDQFNEKINGFTKANVHSLLVPSFSTTTQNETMAYEITMLETVKKSFNLIGGSGCGIPEIILTGTKEDWKNIYKKLDELKIFGLQDWLDALKPVIQEFINVYDKNIDLTFWNSIYKESKYYGEFSISGWMLKFFPYIKKPFFAKQDSITGNAYESFNYELNPYIEGESFLLSDLSTENFPSGISKVEMTWEIHDLTTGKFIRNKPLILAGGFIGIIQDEKTKTISTEINWAVCDTLDVPKEKYYLKGYSHEEIEHVDEKWTTKIYDTVDVLPVFDSLRNLTYEKGIIEFKKQLKAKLNTHKELVGLLAGGFSFNCIITSSGTIARVTLNHKKLNSLQQKIILHEILSLSTNWSSPLKIFNYDRMNPFLKGTFKVNYPINFFVKN